MPWRAFVLRGVLILISRGSVLATMSFVTRSFGLHDSGRYFLMLSATTLWCAGLAVGLPDAVGRVAGGVRNAADRASAQRALTGAISLGLLLSVVVTVGLAVAVPAFADADLALILMPAVLGAQLALELVPCAWLRATGRGGIAEVLASGGAIMSFVLVLLLSQWTLGSITEVIGLRIVCEAGALLTALWAVRRALALRRPWWRNLSSAPLIAAPMWLTGLCWLALQQADVVMLGWVKGSGAVGTYGPILKSVDLAAIPLGLVAAYALPMAARFAHRDDRAALTSVYAQASRIAFVLAAPVLCLMIVAPAGVVSLLFGAHLDTSGEVAARILAAGYWVNACLGLNGATLEAVGRVGALASRSVAALVIAVAADALLIPSHGVVGAAAGTLVAYVFINVVNSAILARSHGIPPWQPKLVVPVTAALAVTAVGLLVPSAQTGTAVATVSVGLAAFVAVAAATVVADHLGLGRRDSYAA